MKKIVPILLLLPLLIACALVTPPPTAAPTQTPKTATPTAQAPRPRWQVQYAGDLELDIDVVVFDLDYDEDAFYIETLHNRGIMVVCYLSGGSWEDWREDADLFPEEVLGNDYEGWPGERWLDIRRIDLLAPIMQARLDQAAAKGCDGVDIDNIELIGNNTGFAISYDDQLAYALWLAEQAHAGGLVIGQKNAPDMVADLAPVFNFAVIESAFYYEWAEEFLPYIEAGKAVVAIEYLHLQTDFDAVCELSEELGFSTILKNRNLDAWVEYCP